VLRGKPTMIRMASSKPAVRQRKMPLIFMPIAAWPDSSLKLPAHSGMF
jgi:hypothetical protein